MHQDDYHAGNLLNTSPPNNSESAFGSAKPASAQTLKTESVKGILSS